MPEAWPQSQGSGAQTYVCRLRSAPTHGSP